MGKDGMNYAPKGKAAPVVGAGEFCFAAAALDHGHIYGQCNGLIEAGAELRYVYDPDPEKVRVFCETYPQATPVDSLERLLDEEEIRLIAAAAIPSERGPLGIRVMEAGKDYFTDKTPFTTLGQLAEARKAVVRTGKKYMVYFSERLHVECAMHAGDLIRDGVIGDVVQVLGLGPHRLSADQRPDWFFKKAQYGGILTDIGSHQFEQFLYYANATDAEVTYARVANYANPEYPELEDFGEAVLVADNGASNYIRVDWFTPDGLGVWGDGRTLITGTKGTIELRKYTNVAAGGGGEHLYLVTEEGEEHMELAGKVGFPYFGQLVLDCINRTETAMTQEHAFKAAELCLKAQEMAEGK
ncbi:MAG: Gfo/Idh/MocA family oxidoreductase [Verrucomicrobiota bacterium]